MKWFRPAEPLAAEADTFRQAYYEDRLNLAAPDLLLYELANGLRYAADAKLEDSVRAIESVIALGIEIAPATSPVIIRALKLAHEYDITVYDAIFVALAEAWDADLVTADEKLLTKLRGVSFCHALTEALVPPILPGRE
jgi:predicted nucleic acid-binding protein